MIRSATKHWPANERWSEPDYLSRLLGEHEIAVHRDPVLEMRWRQQHWPDRFMEAFDEQVPTMLNFTELAELAASDEFVFAYAIGIDARSCLAALENDIGEFQFLPNPAPPNFYQRLRAFVHGTSYTDWHCHPDDETLMCQFGRSKTVHILPPDQNTWDVMTEVAQQENHIGPVGLKQFPRLKTLTPFVAEVHPGDAVYIPPNWWHAVQCVQQTRQLGVTVAYCWGSPPHIRMDPRFPFRRFYLRHGDWRRRLQLAAAAALWSTFALAGKTLKNVPASTKTAD